ncbi:hypothetical protein RF007C_05220 [Ruminococcus flavefaciens 007c]|uniref:Uncharacterized protein n=1 Tax=Ruminococcus flavefaciens 007c TaxID=1341157 RepID=W7UV75_RUMFL|nr:hypothetical protein RF007C_05220 [Ruminococcus flavefaciens 007c]
MIFSFVVANNDDSYPHLPKNRYNIKAAPEGAV